jgi:hypothetical protein
MANILDLITIGDNEVLVVDADPSTSTGAVALVGSLALFNNAGVGQLYLKTGSSNTAWSISRTGLIDLTNQVTNSLPVVNGGTGATTAPNALTNLGAVAKAGDTMTGLLTLNAGATVPTGQVISITDAPTAATSAANKAYVDSVAQGLDVKNSVRALSTTNLTLSGTQTVDGVALIAGDRILVTGQTTAANNGIYVVAAGAWTRAADADTSAKLTAGMFTFIEEGTTNADSGWVLTTNQPLTLGTTSLAFSQFSGAGSITAGTALSKSGNTLNVLSDGSTLGVNGSNQLFVANSGITATQLATAVAGAGLQGGAGSALSVRINSNSGLVSNLGAGTNELGINLASSNPSLQLSSNQLDVKLLSGGGLSAGASGLFVNLGAASITGTTAIGHGGTGLTATPTNGQLLIGNGAGYTLNTLSAGSTKLSVTNASGSITLDVVPANIDKNTVGGSALTVANGGTGQSSFTNGQLLIGNTTGNTLTPGTLTAGNNITITNGAGSITIATTNALIASANTVNTTDATLTTLKTIATTTDNVAVVEMYILARRTGGTAGSAGDSAVFRRTFRIKNVAGTVTVQNQQSDLTGRDQASWNIAFNVSGTNVLAQVTGATNNNITWTGNTKTQSA